MKAMYSLTYRFSKSKDQEDLVSLTRAFLHFNIRIFPNIRTKERERERERETCSKSSCCFVLKINSHLSSRFSNLGLFKLFETGALP